MKTFNNVQDSTHDTLHKANKKLHALQDTVQDRLQPLRSKTEDALLGGLETTQHTLKKGLETAQEKSARTQDNLRHLQQTTQKHLTSGWSATQDKLEDGSKQIRKNLALVTATTLNADKALKTHYKHHKSKRVWGRRLFGWGLIGGVILALLFAPISGVETRKRIARFWEQYKQYLARIQEKALG